MKKCLAVLLSLLLVLCCVVGAMAEAKVEKILETVTPDENGNYVFGEGKTPVAMLIFPDPASDESVLCIVNTDKTTVLEAFQEVGLIEGEEVSWGYNVLKAADFLADYEKDGTYWSIGYLADDGMYRLEDSIQKITIEDYPAVVFALEK